MYVACNAAACIRLVRVYKFKDFHPLDDDENLLLFVYYSEDINNQPSEFRIFGGNKIFRGGSLIFPFLPYSLR